MSSPAMASSEPRLLGTLLVVAIRAKNLPDKSRLGKQHPYCSFKYGGEIKRTKVIPKGGQHPEFDDEVRFSVYEDTEDILARKVSSSPVLGASNPPLPLKEPASLSSSVSSVATAAAAGTPKRKPAKKAMTLQVFADDSKEPKLVGEVVVNLEEVLKKGEHDDWYTLMYKDRYAGEVSLEMTYFIHGAPPIKAKIPKPIQRPDYGGPGTFQPSPSTASSIASHRRPVSMSSMSSLGSLRPSDSVTPVSGYGHPHRQGSLEGLGGGGADEYGALRDRRQSFNPAGYPQEQRFSTYPTPTPEPYPPRQPSVPTHPLRAQPLSTASFDALAASISGISLNGSNSGSMPLPYGNQQGAGYPQPQGNDYRQSYAPPPAQHVPEQGGYVQYAPPPPPIPEQHGAYGSYNPPASTGLDQQPPYGQSYQPQPQIQQYPPQPTHSAPPMMAVPTSSFPQLAQPTYEQSYHGTSDLGPPPPPLIHSNTAPPLQRPDPGYGYPYAPPPVPNYPPPPTLPSSSSLSSSTSYTQSPSRPASASIGVAPYINNRPPLPSATPPPAPPPRPASSGHYPLPTSSYHRSTPVPMDRPLPYPGSADVVAPSTSYAGESQSGSWQQQQQYQQEPVAQGYTGNGSYGTRYGSAPASMVNFAPELPPQRVYTPVPPPQPVQNGEGSTVNKRQSGGASYLNSLGVGQAGLPTSYDTQPPVEQWQPPPQQAYNPPPSQAQVPSFPPPPLPYQAPPPTNSMYSPPPPSVPPSAPLPMFGGMRYEPPPPLPPSLLPPDGWVSSVNQQGDQGGRNAYYR